MSSAECKPREWDMRVDVQGVFCFIVIDGFVMPYKKLINVSIVLINSLFEQACASFCVCLLPLFLCNSGNEHQNNDVIKWKHYPHYWPFVWGIHQPPVKSPHKGQWRRTLMFSLICALNKWLSKQPWGWWFETSLPSLWCHCNEITLHDHLNCLPVQAINYSLYIYFAFTIIILLVVLSFCCQVHETSIVFYSNKSGPLPR